MIQRPAFAIAALMFSACGCANDVPPEDSSVERAASPELGFGIGPVVRAIAQPASESEASLDVVIQVSPRSSGPIVVNFMTVDGTAKVGSDYEHRKGQVQFKPGWTETSISIPLIDDDIAESSETFSLRLHVAKGAELATPIVELTITDDD